MTSLSETRCCLNDGWTIASSATIAQPGALLASPAADTRGWYQADLPATVMSAMVAKGDRPDPFYSDNLRQYPGHGPPAQNFSNHPMPDDSPFAVPWWFRKEFRVPAEAGPHLRLQLDGINYRGTVWLNGRRVGETLVGAYRVFELDVTDLVDRKGTNVLAIELTAPSPCDLAITWVDWNPSPPDKNLGIWRDVWLCWSGPVALRAPFVASRVEPDGSRARLTLAGDLVNVTDRPQAATVTAELFGQIITHRFLLAAREERAFELTAAQHAVLDVAHPRLWWPRFMGEAVLHHLELDVTVAGARSDRTGFDFGIRQIDSTLTEHGHRLFLVNHKPVLIRGAGWASDLFLRRQPERDWAQLAYVKALNLNTIRFEGVLERAEFLEQCDREGLLVIAGWCCCDCWEKWDKWSEENHTVGAESLRSQLRRVRRHPCMLTWWYGSDFPPPPRVERSYLQVIEEVRWPNAHQSSAANKPTEVTGASGLKMEGPYEYVPPGYWLEDTARGGAFGFATEISPGAAVPPVESLRKMLPPEHLWPIDAMWDFHAGGQEFHTVSRFAEALTARYGACDSVDEFARLAQLVTYEGQRAMFEAYTRNKYRATGVIQWMLNNAWPSMIWHLHDHYLRPGGGSFGTQKACEPLHVMYAYDDRTVVVTNQHGRGFRDLVVKVRVVDGDSRPVLAEQVVTDVAVAADDRTVVLTLPPPTAAVTFVDLRLETAGGELVSSNLYWLPRSPDVVDYERAYWLHAPTAQHADLGAVRRMAAASVDVRVTRGDGVRVQLDNPSDRLAFFVQLRLADAAGADVLPVVWSDNYVSLLPGDSRTLHAALPPGGGVMPRDVQVEVRGMNVPAIVVVATADEGRQAVGRNGNGGNGNGSGGNGHGGGGGGPRGRGTPADGTKLPAIPVLVLDDSDGPATRLQRERANQLIGTVLRSVLPRQRLT